MSDFQMKCEANPEGENGPFIFPVCLKSVSIYHFKLAYVVLQIFLNPLLKLEK